MAETYETLAAKDRDTLRHLAKKIGIAPQWADGASMEYLIRALLLGVPSPGAAPTTRRPASAPLGSALKSAQRTVRTVRTVERDDAGNIVRILEHEGDDTDRG